MAELLVSSPIPENLRAIIEHYSSQLKDEQRSMLSAAAVCGAEFRVDLLSQVLERDAVDVAEECAGSCAAASGSLRRALEPRRRAG